MTSLRRIPGTRLAAILLPAALLLSPAGLPGQNACPDGGTGSPLRSFELDSATGGNAHLGVASLGGRYYVSARGAGAIPPHRVHVFDAQGALLRSFDQPPATAASSWGLRDLATDGASLFGGDESGVHGFDTQGNVVTSVVAANGTRTLASLSGSRAQQILGTFRALAFDRAGNGGEGSFWSANLTSDLVEFDLTGRVLGQHPNTSGWSLYGLALDPCSGRLWGSSQEGSGVLVEIDPASGRPTGRRIDAPGIHGGLDIHAAPGGLRTLFARIDQTSPDLLHVGVLHQVPGVCDGLEAWSQVDSGAADRSFKTLGPGATTLTLGTRGTPASVPTAWFVNLGPDALLCGDLTYLGSPWRGIGDFAVAFAGSRPSGFAVDFAFPSGQPVPLTLAALPAGLFVPMRAQAIWLDSRVPGPLVPILATNEVELSIDRRPPLGILFEAVGTNSFNADPAQGFFALTNPSATAIERVVLEAAGGMVFDFAQTGMADRFDGGNSSAVGCRGTFRNGSDVTAGLDYSVAPVSPCDPSARQPHLEIGPSGPRTTIRFRGGAFRNGAVLEWDLDTDGGAGVDGAAMAGMRITVRLAGGGERSGVLAADPNRANRAFVVL